MADVLTKEQRSYNMSRIRGRDTSPEMKIRSLLWKKGFRYRVKNRLPGRPDIVFQKQKVAIFIDGCFWHCCPKCFRMPETNMAFWRKKFRDNRERDRKVNKKLKGMGWKALRFWDHEIKTSSEKCFICIKKHVKKRNI